MKDNYVHPVPKYGLRLMRLELKRMVVNKKVNNKLNADLLTT